ncbi:YjbQ family protein [Streptococcus dysgalactiae]|uniref:YjbQ family protein n=1 Tax=Streptococcus dysgalactiae TaxID=1334 RepID=UPI001CF58387|nr:YjbQ family protein [Streptococcus dysgalactiae]MCB2831226.1 YjbQ family protein [Streptococcus dysgalactiae subsp. dysgalactiae]
MIVYQKEFSVETVANRDSYHDISEVVRQVIAASSIQTGICVVATPHTTCSVFFEEYTHDKDAEGDDFLNLDLSEQLERIIPRHFAKESYHYPGPAHYQAVLAWENPEDWLPNGDKTALWNADAHLKATLLGSSQTIAITSGKWNVGKTGYLYLVDFDRTRERKRHYHITVIGD